MVTTLRSHYKVEEIIEDAKKYGTKGRYYVYEQYKQRLWDACESTTQYEQACIELAKVLKV